VQSPASVRRFLDSVAEMKPDEKQRRIADANGADRCPNCGRLLGGNRLGSGAHRDGVFCSLDCQTTFHHDYFDARARASSPSQN
jgi:hypothetical protein